MGGMKISELDFLRLLPAFMRDDEAVIALSEAMNKLMGEPGKRVQTIRTWDKIDELSEAECDELAWELDIDWYDSKGMSLAEKQETIKFAQQIKRKRGTKWAVERLITSYFGEGYVMEWYDMDRGVTRAGSATAGMAKAGAGNNTPYTFIVLITSPKMIDGSYDKFVEAVKAAKNERSHLAGIFYYWQQDPAIECAPRSSLHKYEFRKCGTHDRAATIGFIVKSGIETEPETTHALYAFPKCGENGYKATHGAAIVGTAIAGRAVATS